jgi:hypothetical protein
MNVRRSVIPIILSSLVVIMLLGAGCMQAPPFSRPEQNQQNQTRDMIPITPTHLSGLPDPASIYITYPEFDGGVRAGNVTVTAEVRNFSLVNGADRPVTAGEGHIIFFKDVTPRTDPGLPAKTSQGTYQVSDKPSCTWYNVTEGTHTFSVELVNNDDTPLVPAVIDAVDVTAVVDD